MSYRKHLRLAAGVEQIEAHRNALFGALASRYRTRGLSFDEPSVWSEVSPFMCITNPQGAIEALAEYVVFVELPQQARVPWLQAQIETAIVDSSDSVILGLVKIGAADGLRHQWHGLITPVARSVLDTLPEDPTQLTERLRVKAQGRAGLKEGPIIKPALAIALTVSEAIGQDDDVQALLDQATGVSRSEAELQIAAYLFFIAWLVELDRAESPIAASGLVGVASLRFVYSSANETGREESARGLDDEIAFFKGTCQRDPSAAHARQVLFMELGVQGDRLQVIAEELWNRYHTVFAKASEREQNQDPSLWPTRQEWILLSRHLTFYEQMWSGMREPATEGQKHFLCACRGECSADTVHETAFLKFLNSTGSAFGASADGSSRASGA
jgi:hypothetical protein